jgi:hypothetical protein
MDRTVWMHKYRFRHVTDPGTFPSPADGWTVGSGPLAAQSLGVVGCGR